MQCIIEESEISQGGMWITPPRPVPLANAYGDSGSQFYDVFIYNLQSSYHLKCCIVHTDCQFDQ